MSFLKKLRSWSSFLIPLLIGTSLALILAGFWQREFWYDEAFTGIIVRGEWQSLWHFIVNDVHPPLYYILLKLWGMLFGFSDIALRGFSVAMFSVCLSGIFLLTNCLIDKKFAFWCTLFFAINPFFLQHAQEARMYMLLLAFSIFAIYFFFRIIEEEKQSLSRNYILFAIFLGLAFLTHYFAIFLWIGLFTAYTAWWFIKQKNNIKIYLIMCLKVISIVFVTIAFWLPFLIKQISKHSSFSWISVRSLADFPEILAVFLFGSHAGAISMPPINSLTLPFSPISFALILLILISFFTRGVFIGRKPDDRWKIILLFIISFVPLFIFFSGSIFGINILLERYMLFILPSFFCFILLVSFYIHRLFLPIFIGIYLVLTLFFIGPRFTKTHFRDLNNNSETQSSSELIFTDPFSYAVGKFYFPNKEVWLFPVSDLNQDFSQWIIIGNDVVIRNVNELPSKAALIDKDSRSFQFTSLETVEEFSLYRIP